MKFTARVLKIFARGSSSFPSTRLRIFKTVTFFKILHFQISKNNKFRNFKIPKLPTCKVSKIHIKKLGTQTFQTIHNFRFSDMKNVKGVPSTFLDSLKYFGDKYRVRGSTFNRFVGSSRNHLKNIATCPGVKISHF